MIRYLTAKQATETLGITAATLYAYVSRGLIRSEVGEGDTRERRYLAEDVNKLVKRKAQRGSPDKGAREALQWGSPVLESALTLIDDDKLYYRGQDATQLAVSRTFEEVAALLWTGQLIDADRLFGTPLHAGSLHLEREALSFVARMQIALTLSAEQDLRALDLQPKTLSLTGARILQLLCATISMAQEGNIAERLAGTWNGDHQSERLINAALILCADHELNTSSFAARVVASTGATLYSVVTAGLGALQGFKHGGNTRLVAAFLRDVEAAGEPLPVIRDRLQRGEHIPGFGHVLYRGGDPRAAALLALMRSGYADHPTMQLAERVIEQTNAIIDRAPNIDFALVVLERLLGLPHDAALALFALGRTAGWIAHAMEQYASGQLIRPRAVYTGKKPNE